MPSKSSKSKLNNLGKSFLYLVSLWREIDWFLLLLIVGLTVFGGIIIQSTEIVEELNHGFQHWYIGGIGLVLLMLIASWRYQILLQWHWLIYILTNLSLLAVMIVGVTAKGAQRWLTIGGFNVQPSEFAKIGVIITIAALLHQSKTANFGTLLRTLAITAIPWGLVFLQPDLGTSLVFGAILVSMLYWANTNPAWLLIFISPLVSAILYHLYFPGWLLWTLTIVGVAWFTLPLKRVSILGTIALNCGAVELGNVFWGLLKDYQKDRLVLFLAPEKDPLGGGYHLIQSRIAIGSGEMWGQGLHQGIQTQLNFIPEQHTDFIFSAVGEELGFIGCMVLLAVYWLICFRLVWIASTARDNFGSLLAIGVLAMIAFQVIVNISMTIGLAPITGIPLPWMSYGRSALLTNFIAIGLVESVANYRLKKKNSFYSNS
ncbi:MAG: rod shape-determining protein RodA [Xenococcaceae cyanobacterium]